MCPWERIYSLKGHLENELLYIELKNQNNYSINFYGTSYVPGIVQNIGDRALN